MNTSATSPPHRSTWSDLFHQEELVIGAPAFYGPPIIFVLGPWLLLVLVLIGPFALILTGLLVLAVVAGLVGALVAVIASPYLVIRHLYNRKACHEDRRYRRDRPHWVEARQHAPHAGR